MSAEVFIFVGLVVLLSAWLPLLLQRSALSLPMVAVAVGWLLPVFTDVQDPLVAYGGTVQHVTEVVLLSAVYGAGLNVDRRFSFRAWRSTWRLLAIVMPLSMMAIALLAMGLLDLPVGLAVLLAGMLAPTDPVLASEVQLGPPGTGEEGEARFALTTEAALNDGLAFPFVMVGVGLVDGTILGPADLANWFALELIGTTLGGAAIGVVVGLLLVWVNRLLPDHLRLHVTNSGLAGLALAFVTYGLCELAGVNGLVAVFCEAVAVRNANASHDYARQLAHATGQIERAIMVFVMLFFGFALSHGLLEGMGWGDAIFAAAVLLVIRPVCTWLGLLGSREDRRTRVALGFFGIRGIGSLYYAAYVVANHPPDWNHHLLTLVALTILFSVVLYGATSPIAIPRLVETGRK